MKLTRVHRCNGCLAKNEITFTKPSHFASSFTHYTCVNCESRFNLKIMRKDSEVHFIVYNYTITPKLRQILLNQKKKASQNPFDKMES